MSNAEVPSGAGRRPAEPRPRVWFWPDYSRGNPYQRLLYARAAQRGDIQAGDIDTATHAVQGAHPGGRGSVTFHLHWLNWLLDGAKTPDEASQRAEAFLQKLACFRQSGGRLVWTIHNVVSHDLPFADVEVALAKGILGLADAVHVHSLASLPEIEARYPIPREKLHVLPHGGYVGVYPDTTSRAEARQRLGLSAEDEVMLFLGQVRPYKGLSELAAAFDALLTGRPRARLVLAGRGRIGPMLDALPDRARVVVVNRLIDAGELQYFLRSADIGVFPYRNVLTSGSMMLALSFGLPVVLPDFGMARQTLGRSRAGVLYAAEGGVPALSGAIGQMLARFDRGEQAGIQQEAREIAERAVWEDAGPWLFGPDRARQA